MRKAINELIDRLTVKMHDAYEDDNEVAGDAFNAAITITKAVIAEHEADNTRTTSTRSTHDTAE